MFKNNALSLAVLVALGGLSLVGCGGSENASTSEEVINKTPTTSIDLVLKLFSTDSAGNITNNSAINELDLTSTYYTVYAVNDSGSVIDDQPSGSVNINYTSNTSSSSDYLIETSTPEIATPFATTAVIDNLEEGSETFTVDLSGGFSNESDYATVTYSDSKVITSIIEPMWNAGEFESINKFKDYCSAPRTGNDPYNDNQPYPDKVGSEFTEKMWLRSWSNETYLWYNEIEDNNPYSFESVAAYFAQLKTEQTTDSGGKKDNFHFSEPTEDFFKEAQSGVVSGYGINWTFISNTPPKRAKNCLS